MSKVGALLWKDARGIYRDGFLLYMCAYVPLVAIAAQLASLAFHWPGHPAWVEPLAAATLCLGGIALLARIHRARVR